MYFAACVVRDINFPTLLVEIYKISKSYYNIISRVYLLFVVNSINV
jgi:hypothetical protein